MFSLCHFLPRMDSVKVVCYAPSDIRRARVVVEAVRDGFLRQGHHAEVHGAFDGIRGDPAIAYGWDRSNAFAAYGLAVLHFLYVDLGFWKRKGPGWKFDGYHKVSLDDWCPSVKMRRGCPSDRFAAFGVDVKPWRSSGDNLIIRRCERAAGGASRLERGTMGAGQHRRSRFAQHRLSAEAVLA
jgi:hypothetical protein